MDCTFGFISATFCKTSSRKINLVAPANAWNYINMSLNPADVGTRVESVKQPDGHLRWLAGSNFLLQGSLEPKPLLPEVVINKTSVDKNLLNL